jgi:CHASE2 domain-containing sensor protein
MLSLPIVGPQSSLIGTLNDLLLNFRFQHAPRAASGNIVFLAIDKQTLDDVGVWPWPRSHYALLLDKLSRFGVGDVFIDIDFSTASKPDEDERLRAALSDAGGGTVLPVFKQLQSPDGQAKTVVTQPLPAFAANAWLAFANVAPDDDGKVRRFVLGDTFEGRQVQSVPAVLSQSQLDSGSALIDFSITPVSVPTISLSEVFDPKFDAARLKGRSVVVGAFATELKDIFAVPVYGQLPGPILHIWSSLSALSSLLESSAYATVI